MLIGAETAIQTAMRFESRENFVPTRVPTLTVRYQLGPAGMPAPAAVPAIGTAGVWIRAILMLLLGLRRRRMIKQMPLGK